MTFLKTRWFLCASLAALPILAAAQTTGHDVASHGAMQAAAPADAMSDGEIRKVDKSAGTLTIRHGEIPSLDMGPMTMVFRAQDASMLERVKAGDKVRFRAANVNGELTVTAIEPRS